MCELKGVDVTGLTQKQQLCIYYKWWMIIITITIISHAIYRLLDICIFIEYIQEGNGLNLTM